MPKGSSRKGCNNIDDKTKEIALALLATNMSVPRVAERLNLKVSTVKGWKLKALAIEKAIEEGKITDDGELKLNETRLKNKQNFVNNAWNLINESMEVAHKRVTRSNKLEENIDLVAKAMKANANRIQEETGITWFALLDIIKELQSMKAVKVGELSTLIGTMYDKQALANGEATQNVRDITVEEYLKGCNGDKY